MSNSLADLVVDANRRLLVEGDLEAAEEYFGDAYRVHVSGGTLAAGVDGVRRVVAKLREAFEGLEVEVDVLVEGADRVAWQRTLRGTHRASFRGFPATGGEVVWRDQLTSRFEDGRIVEEWAVSDLAEQLLVARKR